MQSIAPRKEIKFVTSECNLRSLELFLRSSPMNFVECYAPRAINSIYFDDVALNAMRAHMRRDLHRAKLRLRWYGAADGFEHGQLELKEKNCGTGFKHIWAVDGELSSCWQSLRKTLLLQIPPVAQTLLVSRPLASLFIRYQRRYFLSRDKVLRVTFDKALQASDERFFAGPAPQRLRTLTSRPCIMEIKFDIDNVQKAEKFLNSLPFAPRSCSKYLLCARETGFQLPR